MRTPRSIRSTRRLLAPVVLFVTAAGCSGSSPTAPGGSANGDGVSISFNSSALVELEPVIRREIESTFDLARREIPIGGLKVVVDAGRHLVPGWGVGGFAPSPGRRIELSVDRSLAEELIIERLPSITAHELHHVGRHRGPGYGGTLLEAMVSEGLADHYAQELFGRPTPPWAMAIPASQIDLWIEKARPELDSRNYDHGRWFFGRSALVPRWAGYTIGFELVQRYKDANPGATAASLVDAEADLFRPPANSNS